jgi:hypothetical protein
MMMMMTEMVIETSAFYRNLTELIARDDFNAFSRRESYIHITAQILFKEEDTTADRTMMNTNSLGVGC